MRLCWADKIPLALWLCVIGVLIVVGATSGVRGEWAAGVEAAAIGLGYKVFLPLWIVLRGLDLLGGGPARRRVATARPAL